MLAPARDGGDGDVANEVSEPDPERYDADSVGADFEVVGDGAIDPPLTAKPAECWTAEPVVRDHKGVKISNHQKMATWAELVDAVPRKLAGALQEFFETHGIDQPTPFQAAAVPLLLPGHSATLFAPTGAGKTLSYLAPILARLHGARDMKAMAITPGVNAQRQQLEAAAAGHEATVCTYCGLDMTKVSVCPETGAPHPRVSDPMDEAAAMYDGDHEATIRAAAEIAERRRDGGRDNRRVQPTAIIVVPTNLLAQQVFHVALRIRGDAHIGLILKKSRDDTPQELQRRLNNNRGADIIIGTPDSLMLEFTTKRLRVSKVETLVFDEIELLLSQWSELVAKLMTNVRAVRLAEISRARQRQAEGRGGADEENTLARANDSAVQLVTVGAVWSSQLEQLLQVFHARRLFLLTSDQGTGASDSVTTTVEHTVLLLSEVEKAERLCGLFLDGELDVRKRVLVFVSTKHQAARVAAEVTERLADANVRAGYVHGGMPHLDQQGALRRFDRGVETVLVTTDVCAHGIDFENVDAVVNYDMPRVFNTWVHRVGRCGRHGHRGRAFTFFTAEDMAHARLLVRALRQRSQRVPPRLAEYAKLRTADILRRSQALGQSPHQMPQYSRPVTLPLSPSLPSQRSLKADMDSRDPHS